MSNEEIEIHESSGNVFGDLGLPNAEGHLLKAHLVRKIMIIMQERDLTQAQLAGILGLTQPDVSNMLRGRFDRVSVERLLRHLVTLGQDVEIVVTPHRDSDHAPQLRVA